MQRRHLLESRIEILQTAFAEWKDQLRENDEELLKLQEEEERMQQLADDIADLSSVSGDADGDARLAREQLELRARLDTCRGEQNLCRIQMRQAVQNMWTVEQYLAAALDELEQLRTNE